MHRITQRGLTLVELLVTVAIVGLLAATAYPSYTRHLIKTRRATAQACLTEMAQWMERNRTSCMSYAKTGSACTTTVNDATLPALSCRHDLVATYTFALSPAVPPTDSTFLLQASPMGAQAGDTPCGTLTLNQAGVKGSAGTVATCWQ